MSESAAVTGAVWHRCGSLASVQLIILLLNIISLKNPIYDHNYYYFLSKQRKVRFKRVHCSINFILPIFESSISNCGE